MYLWNSAYVHLSVGNTDRAIERFMRMLQLAREFKMPINEARSLRGLALAYWKRGSLNRPHVRRRSAESAAADRRHLRSRRPPAGRRRDRARRGSDSEGTGAASRSIRDGGIQRLTQRQLSHIGRDYAADGDFDRAIVNYRAALATPIETTLPFRVRLIELSLAEALLAHEPRSLEDAREAATLAARALDGAVRNADINMEQSSRRVLAHARAALGELGGSARRV